MTTAPGRLGGARGWILLVALLAGVVVAGLALAATVPSRPVAEVTGRPPPTAGSFSTRPAGAWTSLPGDRGCAARVRRSAWEPRPDNYLPNHRTPDRRAVAAALSSRPRARMGAYAPRWDRWLLPRVSGAFTGTTDEILQWAACKWGLADNVLRAVAMRESGWYQYEVYPDGSCVIKSGCGDLMDRPTPAARRYCHRVAVVLGHPRQDVQGCPRTFSIVGIMSWHDPRWGRMNGNQNGTFPFSVQSTAFAADYFGSYLRGCLEGWVRWLDNTGPYRRSDLPGCLGAWYAGAWKSSEAREYAALVAREVDAKRWLSARWRRHEPPCSPDHGCPQAPP